MARARSSTQRKLAAFAEVLCSEDGQVLSAEACEYSRQELEAAIVRFFRTGVLVPESLPMEIDEAERRAVAIRAERKATLLPVQLEVF